MCTGRAQERRQQGRCRGAIDVVIAEHADALAGDHRIRDTTDRERQTGETGWWAQRREPRIDEARCILRLDNTASDETTSGRRPHAQCPGETTDELLVDRADAYLHTRTLVVGSDTETRQIPRDPCELDDPGDRSARVEQARIVSRAAARASLHTRVGKLGPQFFVDTTRERSINELDRETRFGW